MNAISATSLKISFLNSCSTLGTSGVGSIWRTKSLISVMPTSTIVLIVLRLFCIQWFLEGLAMVATTFALPHRSTNQLVMTLSPGIGMLLASFVIWFASPFLARLVAGKPDAPVSVPVPPLRDLYAFAFVFLGVYFVIKSLGDVALQFHYALITAATVGDFNPERQRSGYELVRSLITLVGGLLCIIFGKTWAGKLSESRSAEPQPPIAP